MLDGQDTSTSVEGSSGEVWGADPTVSQQAPETTQAAPTPAPVKQEPQTFEYQAAGRTVKEPLDLILKRASQGYHYAQSMEAFNKQKAEYDAKIAAAENLNSKWQKYEEFATKNPGWNDHLEKSWQNRHAALADPDNPLSGELASAKQAIDELKGHISKMQADAAKEAHDRKVKSEDEQLLAATKAIRDEYKEFDFDEADADGKSLEYRVVEHATKNGINSFRAAFRDFHHEQLIHKAAEKARADLGKAVQEKAKQGIVGYSPRPKLNTVQTAQNLKGKSYGELTQEALRELRGS